MDFGALRPEINCARMYTGPRRATMLAALVALLLLGTAPSGAAQNDWVAARGRIACTWMDMHPNLYGALSTMRTMQDEGVSGQEIPGVLAAVISTYCPRHADLYKEVKDYLTHMGNPGTVGLGWPLRDTETTRVEQGSRSPKPPHAVKGRPSAQPTRSGPTGNPDDTPEAHYWQRAWSP